MANTRTSMAQFSRPVSVEVGAVPVRRQDLPPPDLCFVGLASFDDPFLGDAVPRALIRDTRYRDEDAFVEHVRLSVRDGVDALPGLTLGRPSRMRDAVRVALQAGAQSVDVVLARIRGLMPWDLDRPEFVYAVDPFLGNLVGACIVMPDIGGPIPLGPGTAHDADLRVERFARTAGVHGGRWAERYQLGLLDDPGVGGDLGLRVLEAAAAKDASIVRWVGQPDDMRAHGWRSAAAFVGGVIAARPGNILAGVSGFRAPLPTGRYVSGGRFHDLHLADAWRARLPEDDYYVDVVPDASRDVGFIRSEPTLRAPVGTWSIPSVRVAKVIHWRVMQTASRFVFETADVGRAIALATAVNKALDPYATTGVLVGPDGSGEPLVRGGVIRDPAEPGLRVEIGAVLLPWSHKVNVRVSLRPGGAPTIEEVA